MFELLESLGLKHSCLSEKNTSNIACKCVRYKISNSSNNVEICIFEPSISKDTYIIWISNYSNRNFFIDLAISIIHIVPLSIYSIFCYCIKLRRKPELMELLESVFIASGYKYDTRFAPIFATKIYTSDLQSLFDLVSIMASKSYITFHVKDVNFMNKIKNGEIRYTSGNILSDITFHVGPSYDYITGHSQVFLSVKYNKKTSNKSITRLNEIITCCGFKESTRNVKEFPQT